MKINVPLQLLGNISPDEFMTRTGKKNHCWYVAQLLCKLYPAYLPAVLFLNLLAAKTCRRASLNLKNQNGN